MAGFYYWLWMATLFATWRPLQIAALVVMLLVAAIMAWDQRHRRPAPTARGPDRVRAWIDYTGVILGWSLLSGFAVLAAVPSLVVLVFAGTQLLFALCRV